MTDFVLESSQKLRHNDDCEFAYVVRKYANFLKQPLTLGMFVPTDERGDVWFVYKPHFDLSAIKHQISQGKTIEYLANHGGVELTESSKKLIYG